MRDLDGGYASLFNQIHEREGTLYQGRFKSILIENESHAWELSRYVHLNPYRAGLALNPFDYPWSSYRYYLAGSRAPDWLDIRTVLAQFSGTEASARIAYKRFVESGIITPPANPLRDAEETGILGSPEFILRCQEWLTPNIIPSPTIDGILESVCAEFGTTPESLSIKGHHHHAARDAAVLLGRELANESLETLATRFGGITKSAVSEITKRARERETTDATFRNHLEAIRQEWR